MLTIICLDAKEDDRSRVVDLDIDIGADAVDYKCVPLYSNTNLC